MTPELIAAANAARTAQPLWSLVPVASRARYIRRAAIAMLDELDDLALRLAEETGWPQQHLMLSELLPAVRGLHALAGAGPRALADRRLSSRSAVLVGRSTRLVHSPVGVIGLRGPSASPWAEPALETAAALLAGNAVMLAAGAQTPRLRGIFLRAGVPGELITVLPPTVDADTGDTDDAAGAGGASGTSGAAGAGGASRAAGTSVTADSGGAAGGGAVADEARLLGAGDGLDAVCRRVIDLPRPTRLGTLLVLEGAPREQVVEAALWAAFGGHAAAAGRLVTVKDAVPGLVAALEAGIARLDPADVTGRPALLAGLTSDDPLFVTPPARPTLAIVEVPDADAAVRLASRGGGGGPVSIWARDRAKGERVARRLPSQTTWVGRHWNAATDVEIRLPRHVVARQLEWRATWAPAPPSLPPDEAIVAAQTAFEEIRHGRESRRWPALRAGAGALVRAGRRKR